MSVPFLQQIECPACDTPRTVTTWSVIDAVADPSARTQLFAGEINAFVCKECGYAGQIVTPLLYFDRERQFSVQYYPADFLDDDAFLDSMSGPPSETEIGALAASERERHEYLLRPHIVFDMDEMLRYIVFCESVWERRHGRSDAD